jgi:hypothetical protein
MNDLEMPTWTPDELAYLRKLWDDRQAMMDVYAEPEPFVYDEPLPEAAGTAMGEFLVDAARHPAETTAEALMWLPQMNVGKWGLKGLAGQLGLEFGCALDKLREGDEQTSKFVDNMMKNPGDWYHLIRGATMGESASPEDLQKTFEPMRP